MVRTQSYLLTAVVVAMLVSLLLMSVLSFFEGDMNATMTEMGLSLAS